MKACGIELKGNEAIICLLTLSDELFQLPDCRVRRMPMKDINSTQDLKDFQFAFAKLMEDYQVEKVIIRQRPTKGKFAGGALGFKMEAAIQLIDNLNVVTISSNAIKESLSHNPIPVEFNETGLKGFQEPAFTTAFAYLMK